MKVSVIIPTYRRPISLKRTLEVLKSQTVLPHEIIVVIREEDDDTKKFFENEKMENLRWVYIKEGGQVIAMNEGLKAADGDIIAFTDDDAEPERRWIEKIIEYMRKEGIGGVGGRDIPVKEIPRERAKIVGKITWFGRHIGNHHLEPVNSAPREVDLLKGVNMAYKREYIDGFFFDPFLDNRTSPMNEVDICMYVKRRGGKIIYDPDIKVYHHVEERKSSSRSDILLRIYEYSRNCTYIMLKHLPICGKVAFLMYFWLIGQRGSYGLMLMIFDLFIKRRKNVFTLWRVSTKGKCDGIKGWIRFILNKKRL